MTVTIVDLILKHERRVDYIDYQLIVEASGLTTFVAVFVRHDIRGGTPIGPLDSVPGDLHA